MSSGVLFVKDKGLIPFLISCITFSKYNHVALRIDDTVAEIMPTRNGGQIYFYPFEEFNKVRKFDFVPVDEIYSHGMFAFQVENQSKNYDWFRTILWPFAQVLKLRDYDSEAWNCIEHVFYSLQSQGKAPWEGSNVSPGQLYKIMKRG